MTNAQVMKFLKAHGIDVAETVKIIGQKLHEYGKAVGDFHIPKNVVCHHARSNLEKLCWSIEKVEEPEEDEVT